MRKITTVRKKKSAQLSMQNRTEKPMAKKSKNAAAAERKKDLRNRNREKQK
jgi:hypothetical protein